MSESAAGIVGTWEVTITTPMGAQVVSLQLTDAQTGWARFGADSVPLQDVTVSVGSARFSAKLTQPMALTLMCAVTVDGDTMGGTASAGFFGKFALTGRRTSG